LPFRVRNLVAFHYFRCKFLSMIKLLTVVGARPQIIKAAALSRTISNNYSGQIREFILHTGQHYDANMSQIFFDELKIPPPDFNLNVGSASHGVQTAAMITGIEEKLLELRPDYIVLYGDTNSTLAGAIAASKMHIPVIHIEAGLRSFNKLMPEEINRIMCDHVSTMLFSPTKTGIKNLIAEGFSLDNRPPYSMDNPGVFHCGDVMFDNSLYFSKIAAQTSQVLKESQLEPGSFVLATIHRNNNTDDPARLNAIFEALQVITSTNQTKIFLPLHPRTAKMLEQNLLPGLLKSIKACKNIIISKPVSFLDMIQLETNAQLIITDSGGVQKEAYFFRKPCIILRPQTEWVEIVENGAATIADADKNLIVNAFEHYLKDTDPGFGPVFGNGDAASFICKKI
jgi:UDP-GlcNAc3NAcA epimerase